MTLLHFVRHGETVWHHENRYAGVSDIALTPKGVGQARDLAAFVTGAGIGAVFCSDLTRAIETATPAAAALDLPLQIDPRLREVDFGRAEGLTATEIRTAMADGYAAFVAAPATSPLPGGETGVSAVARGSAFLGDLDPDAEVLLVAHNTFGRLLLCFLLGLPLDRYRSAFPQVLNGAITTVDLPHLDDLAGTARLLRFNYPTRSEGSRPAG